jgi:hypothetical protein
MQTTPGHATAFRRTFPQESAHHRGVGIQPLTPAERIALTIALLNRGLDRMKGFARTSLRECTRGAFRTQDDADPQRHSLGAY